MGAEHNMGMPSRTSNERVHRAQESCFEPIKVVEQKGQANGMVATIVAPAWSVERLLGPSDTTGEFDTIVLSDLPS
jgi:hypothetical protein